MENLEAHLISCIFSVKENVVGSFYIKNDNSKKVIIFSPSAASFDQFKNFEDRGKFFNNLVKILLKKLKYE